ncbi:MAG: hypothetical protein D6740_13535, partial [Alphaproteobacteria bacterium]
MAGACLLVAIIGLMVAAAGDRLWAAPSTFARAWKAYQKAVQDKAPAAELLPLAQAVYDALP